MTINTLWEKNALENLFCRITSTAKWGLYKFVNDYFSSTNTTGNIRSKRFNDPLSSECNGASMLLSVIIEKRN